MLVYFHFTWHVSRSECTIHTGAHLEDKLQVIRLDCITIPLECLVVMTKFVVKLMSFTTLAVAIAHA